jgi:hypothetical protein
MKYNMITMRRMVPRMPPPIYIGISGYRNGIA